MMGYLGADQTGTGSNGTVQTTSSNWNNYTAGQAMKNNWNNCFGAWWSSFSAANQGKEIDTTLIKARYL